MKDQYIVACEIGSSKVKAAVGTVDNTGALNILALEEEPTLDAVRYGVIRKIEDVSNKLSTVFSRLENSSAVAPGKIKGVYVALGGQTLSSCIREVSHSFEQEKEIDKELIHKMKESAGSEEIPEKEIVAILSRDFMVDSLKEKDPVGIIAHNLVADFNVVYCRPQLKRNIAMTLEQKLGIEIYGYIVRPLAQADMVLTEDEKQLGAMLIDFGAETTTVSIYKNGTLRYLATIPLGSRNITRDITALNMIEKKAEELKKQVGNLDHQVEGATFDGIDNSEINKYISARASEIIVNINEQLEYAGIKSQDLPGGIVIIGGGAKLRGFNNTLAIMMGMKFRQGNCSHKIKIMGSSISASDDVDVISVLDFATRFPQKDCIVFPEEEEKEEIITEDEETEFDDFADNDMEDTDEEKITVIHERAKKKSGGGIFGGLRNKLMDLLNDGGAGDEEDETEK